MVKHEIKGFQVQFDVFICFDHMLVYASFLLNEVNVAGTST